MRAADPVPYVASVIKTIGYTFSRKAPCAASRQVVRDPIFRKFAANDPGDDWPAVMLPPHPRSIEPGRARSDHLAADVFALVGFVAQHFSGTYAPDGILDLPLGPARVSRGPRVQEYAAREVRQPAAPRRSRDVPCIDQSRLRRPRWRVHQPHRLPARDPAARDLGVDRNGRHHRCATTSTATNAATSSHPASSLSASPISSGAAAMAKKSASSSCVRSSAAKATPRSAR